VNGIIQHMTENQTHSGMSDESNHNNICTC
jgi:hypothetical protein